MTKCTTRKFLCRRTTAGLWISWNKPSSSKTAITKSPCHGNVPPSLQNNRAFAKPRLSLLKKRLELGPLGTHWYLPYHPVFNPQEPGKIRGTSLNAQLLQGPDLTNSLVWVLCRFRQELIAVMCDVEATFHQVHVRSSDCDALRFLWWPDGNLEDQPQEYQMTVHLFGGASSPSCTNFALKRTVEHHSADFDTETVETVKRNLYVDDCLKSVSSEDKAI